MASVEVLNNFIGGNLVPCSRHIDSYNPATGEVHLKVPDSGQDEVNLAVEAAKQAFERYFYHLYLIWYCMSGPQFDIAGCPNPKNIVKLRFPISIFTSFASIHYYTLLWKLFVFFGRSKVAVALTMHMFNLIPAMARRTCVARGVAQRLMTS